LQHIIREPLRMPNNNSPEPDDKKNKLI
jgi:hypothetical protein